MIGVISSGYGNVIPIINILKMKGIRTKLISSTKDATDCDKLIIPGVGAFDPFLTKLKGLGLDDVIYWYASHNKPILGICIGAHVLCRQSEEGILAGLDLINVGIKKFNKIDKMRIPHMGWNKITAHYPNPIFNDMEVDHRFYFVHSYHFCDDENIFTLATSLYGYEFPSILSHKNIIAAQFHPEKSQKHGMKMLENFALYVE